MNPLLLVAGALALFASTKPRHRRALPTSPKALIGLANVKNLVGKPAVSEELVGEHSLEQLAREGKIILPSGGGWVSNALSAGANTALSAAKSYADAKTGGAVSKAEGQINEGNYVGAAGTYNAGVTVGQRR